MSFFSINFQYLKKGPELTKRIVSLHKAKKSLVSKKFFNANKKVKILPFTTYRSTLICKFLSLRFNEPITRVKSETVRV